MARREGAPTVVEDPTFAHGVLFFAARPDLRDVRAVEKWLDGGKVGRTEEQHEFYDAVLKKAMDTARKAREKAGARWAR